MENGERPRRSTLLASGGAVARSSNGSLKLAEVALAPRWDAVFRGEREGLEELQGRVLFLAVPDPAAHPAFLAADLAAAFPSASTGHTFSSRDSIKYRARRFHVILSGVNETLLYNPRAVQSQGLYGAAEARSQVTESQCFGLDADRSKRVHGRSMRPESRHSRCTSATFFRPVLAGVNRFWEHRQRRHARESQQRAQTIHKHLFPLPEPTSTLPEVRRGDAWLSAHFDSDLGGIHCWSPPK